MQTTFSKKSLTELYVIDRMLSAFLDTLDPIHRDQARDVALSGCLHALRTTYAFLRQIPKSTSTSLLHHQIKLADIVVSSGGLNDAARTFLRSSDFASRLTASHHFTQPTPTELQPPLLHAPKSQKPGFNPLQFFPCVVGSGRLAAAFLAGFQALGVPNEHVTIVSRSSMTPSSPLNTWLETLLQRDPHMWAYKCLTFAEDFLRTQETGPVFLLIKRKAFDDPSMQNWLQRFRKHTDNPVVINLMAGGALNLDDEQEIILRANVLVSSPGGGNLLAHEPQLNNCSWQQVWPILKAMGSILPVSDRNTQGKLTFFTSTVPLVMLAEIDRVCYQNLPRAISDSLTLQCCAERCQIIEEFINGNVKGEESLGQILEPTALKYMDIYLDLA